ncbi:MAG: SGNH/GDSL hydrolase family protein [Chloroflexota bacterium]
MPTTIKPNDSHLTWLGAVSVEHTDAYSMPWRIPYIEQSLFHPELVKRAAMPAGVRLSFMSNTTMLVGHTAPYPEMSPLDLFVDGQHVDTATVDVQGRFRFVNLPPRPKRIDLWLPQFGEFRLQELTVESGTTINPISKDNGPRWITYGSSITQCRTADSPAHTWPAIAARYFDYDLTCLGFGGQCHLDSMMARVIRDRPADFISLCVGINIYGGSTLNARTFAASFMGFIQIVREGHRYTPLVIMSPIYSPKREYTKNVAGLTLQEMRSKIAQVVTTLQAHGDKHIHYVNGLDIFGPALVHLLPDDLHPNADGYRMMGKHFIEQVASRYFIYGDQS